MSLSAFDPLAGVITHRATVTCGLHALTVQNRRRGPTALAVSLADKGAQSVIQSRPLMVANPLPENMVNGFAGWKIGRQVPPGAATLDDIQDGIQDAPPIRGWASAFGGFGQHGFEVSPLGVRETGIVYGVFHALTEAAPKMSRRNPSRMSTYLVAFLHSSSNSPLNRNAHPEK